jgi:hypothetical protein
VGALERSYAAPAVPGAAADTEDLAALQPLTKKQRRGASCTHHLQLLRQHTCMKPCSAMSPYVPCLCPFRWHGAVVTTPALPEGSCCACAWAAFMQTLMFF